MKVLGITGGIGAGKSTVLQYLETRYHAHVIQADQVGHVVQEPGQECYSKVTEAFGKTILQEDGTIDRKKLAEIVFGDEERRKTLNRLVHPAVKQAILEEISLVGKKENCPFIVVEAALFLEEHYEAFCDAVWYIYADEQTRKERLMRSRGYSEQKIRHVMDSQKKEAQYREKCDLVIDNSSDFVENTFEQIDKGLNRHGFL